MLTRFAALRWGRQRRQSLGTPMRTVLARPPRRRASSMLPLRGRGEHTRAHGPLLCDLQRPSASVAPRLTVTADTARLSGANQAAARPKTGGTAGSPGETLAM